jgi:glycosyltransferase involved in cell wall biosynthesis
MRSAPGSPATFHPVRILIVSALYPPVAFGGYEVECSAVAEHLSATHSVLVLTSDRHGGAIAESVGTGVDAEGAGATARVEGAGTGTQPQLWRELAPLTPDWRGALRAPRASLRAVASARRALAWQPDLIYVWNGSSIAQACLRVLADSEVPLAFRVCEHWFGGIFLNDQFMRELIPSRRGPARALWAAGCRAVNALPRLRLSPAAPLRTAISWNSEAIRQMVDAPGFIEPVLERVGHSVPRYGELYAQLAREPAPQPEILYLGRVTPYKGVAVAIEALALLLSEHRIAARLVVVGPEDARYGVEMRALAERLGVAGAIDWRGQAPPERAAAALARAHALIVPSLWQEPFPLVTIEGAFARVPLVASDVGGISEGMHDGEHALLFPRGDAAAAAAALARTLTETDETHARAARALQRAQAFRLGPYLQEQERFVLDAHEALQPAVGKSCRSVKKGGHAVDISSSYGQ